MLYSNLFNSTFLCAQAMTHARGLYKPEATSEHDLHTKRFVSAFPVHWYLLVPSAMKIATSRGLLRWLTGHRFGPLCGLVASGHMYSEFAFRWHVHSTADIWNEISASSVRNFSENTHRVDVAEWPNGGRGPCASQSQVDSLSQSFWWRDQKLTRKTKEMMRKVLGRMRL